MTEIKPTPTPAGGSVPPQQPVTQPAPQTPPPPLPEEKKKSPIFIIIAIVLVIVAIIALVLFFTNKSFNSKTTTTSNNSNANLVTCTSTANIQPIAIPGYKTTIYSSSMAGGSGNNMVDNGTRSFSLKGIIPKTNVDDIYFGVQKVPSGSIAGLKALMEICDTNNQAKKGDTTADTTTTPASKEALGVYYYMHGGTTPVAPGNYRVDGYVNIDGTWKLVARMSGVTITD